MHNQTLWKVIYSILAVVCLALAAWFGYNDRNQPMWLMFLGFVIFIVVCNAGVLAEITFSLSKFSIRMRDIEKVTQQAQATIQQLQALATTLVSASLLGVMHAGRAGGLRYEESESIKVEAISMLKDIGATEEQVCTALARWHPYVEFDYAHYILGGPLGLKNVPNHLRKRLDELRGGGTRNRAKPDEIRQFLSDTNLLTEDRKELLADYEYYVQHREHRRPEVWMSLQDKYLELQ